MGNGSVADATAFREAAVKGKIGVDPDAAETVLKKIRAGKDAVEQLIQGAGPLADPPKLGANPVGTAMAAKFSDRAEGRDDSYVAALRNLFAQYEQAEQGIVTAMSRYRDIDQDSAEPFRGA